MKPYHQLMKIFKRLSHLQYLQRILTWDEAVMMPHGAGKARAHALATLNRTIHKILTNKKINELIKLVDYSDVDLSEWDQINVNWMEKKHKRATCIPLSLAEEVTKASIVCEQAWRELRAKNNWQDFVPYLEKSFQLTKEIAARQADALNLSPYDALIDDYAPGFDQARIDHVFDGLKNILPELIKKITAKQAKDKIQIPQGPFTFEKQKQLGLEVMQALGFDFRHGRLDVSHHPFCSGGPSDVRVTTRYTENEFLNSLFAICHETGHAMYEQGLPKKWLDQPVGHVQSMANHESQSLLIEMEICRSLAFNEFISSLARKQFGEQAAFTADNLYKVVTRVKPDYIRVDADEVTYPLHIILRYEIEKELFNDEISIKDLPERWDDLMQKYLGLSTKDNYKDGVMQDVHWPSGAFGYFPAYTLGRLMAAQIFSTFKSLHPNYADNIRDGNFQTIRQWLNDNVYSYASSLATNDLLLKVTGNFLDATYFIEHINQRYCISNTKIQ